MKKNIKVVTIFLVAIMLLATSSFAAVDFNTVKSELKVQAPTSAGEATDTVNKVLGALQWGSMAAGIIILTVLGVKYMMGSVAEKSEYKKSMIPLVIGIIVVMSAFTIARILFGTFAG